MVGWPQDVQKVVFYIFSGDPDCPHKYLSEAKWLKLEYIYLYTHTHTPVANITAKLPPHSAESCQLSTSGVV